MEKKYKKSKALRRLADVVSYIFASIALIIAFVPFFFMVLNSFKDKYEILLNGTFKMPKAFKLDNYIEVFQKGITKYFINSTVVLVLSLSILIVISLCAAYPLARLKFKLSKTIYALIVACMSIPIHITLIPVFQMTKAMRLYDTIWALIGPNVAFGIPMSVFILVGFLKGIPKELEDAAQVDGSSYYGIFWRIIVPLSKPGIATIAIYEGVSIWNEFSFAYTLTQSSNVRTLPLSIWDFQSKYSTDMTKVMAVLVICLIPMLVLFAIEQDKLVKGMTAGAVKG